MTIKIFGQLVQFELKRKEEVLNENPQVQQLIKKVTALEKAKDNQETINKLLIKQLNKQHLAEVAIKKQWMAYTDQKIEKLEKIIEGMVGC